MHSMPVAPPVDQIVLIVDNDPAVRASLQFVLEIEGFVVSAFRTAEELLAQDPLPQKACIIVDFSLPKMNGFELATALRDRGIDFPTILMAADPPAPLRQQAFESGLKLVEKPTFGNKLTDVIRAALTET